MFKRILQFLIFCLLVSTIAQAKTSTVDAYGVRLGALANFSGQLNGGYCFYSVYAVNRTADEKQIRLSMRSTYSSELEEVARSFRLAAGESRTESIFFPVMDFSSDGMRVEIDGILVQERIFPYVSVYRDYYRKKAALVDNRISKSEFSAVFDKGGSYGLEMNVFDGGLDQFENKWLAYTRFNSLIFYSDSLQAMSNETKNAIFSYIRAGGNLLVLGHFQPPADFYPCSIENPTGIPDFQGFSGGFGTMIVCDEDVLERVATVSGDPFPTLEKDPLGLLSSRGNSPLAFRDGDVKMVSAQWLMILIYAFAFLIGPVNVYVLHKMRKKIWVFWTVPVASAVCCLMIFGYYLIFESSVLLVKKQALTFLDQRNNLAVTLGNLAVYSSASKPEGFRFSFDTEARPIAPRRYRHTDNGKFINLDEDQNFAEGWIRPKVPRYFHVRTAGVRRERISIERGDGGMLLLNGLGADIKILYFMAEDGRIFHCQNLKAGSRAALSLSNRQLSKRRGVTEMHEVFENEWFSHYERLHEAPENYLKPGNYIAWLDRAPFLNKQSFENGTTQEDSVVFGVMGGQL